MSKERSPRQLALALPDEHKLTAQTAAQQRRQLREALAPYINVRQLRRLAAEGANVREALIRPNPPQEVIALLDTLSTILHPIGREQVTSPADIAALLMVEMGYLEQEQLRVVCLNTKNYIQKICLVYKGSVNLAIVRVAEIFRVPLALNSAAIILAHNHPSGDPEPSPEDIAVTRQVIEAGTLLGCEVLDHVIIGQGRWVSLRKRKIAFT